jgi:hypothetical protein
MKARSKTTSEPHRGRYNRISPKRHAIAIILDIEICSISSLLQPKPCAHLLGEGHIERLPLCAHDASGYQARAVLKLTRVISDDSKAVPRARESGRPGICVIGKGRPCVCCLQRELVTD